MEQRQELTRAYTKRPRLVLAAIDFLCMATLLLAQNSNQTVREGGDDRVAYIGFDLAEQEQLMFMSAMAASRRQGVVLLESKQASRRLAQFIDRFEPERTVCVGNDLGACQLSGERV